jgi:hypothetical protein
MADRVGCASRKPAYDRAFCVRQRDGRRRVLFGHCCDRVFGQAVMVDATAHDERLRVVRVGGRWSPGNTDSPVHGGLAERGLLLRTLHKMRPRSGR